MLPVSITRTANGDALLQRCKNSMPQRVEFSLDALRAVPPPQDIADPRVTLGRELFADTRLSRDNTVACASCPRRRRGRRRRPSYSRRHRTADWPHQYTDRAWRCAQRRAVLGRARRDARGSARAADREPDRNGLELARVLASLSADAGLAGPLCGALSGRAQRSERRRRDRNLRARARDADSAFDRYLVGDASAMAPAAPEGFELFERLGCASCHQGRNLGGNMFQRFGVMGDYFADRGHPTEADFGRYNVTGAREDQVIVFKVPSLRNVAATAPYFHDGSAATLETPWPSCSSTSSAGRSAEQVRAQLVAFLALSVGARSTRLCYETARRDQREDRADHRGAPLVLGVAIVLLLLCSNQTGKENATTDSNRELPDRARSRSNARLDAAVLALRFVARTPISIS